MSSINIRGTMDVETARRSGELALSQILTDIEVKQLEACIPANTASPLSVPLPMNSGVTELLFIHVYSPKAIILVMEFTDTNNAGASDGPVRLGLKGMLTLTLSPGEGLKTLAALNLSTTDDVTIDYVTGAKKNNVDQPEYWYP